VTAALGFRLLIVLDGVRDRLRRNRGSRAFVAWETWCPGVEGYAVCVRGGWIRDRHIHRCSGCGGIVPSETHPFVYPARG
jgi:hypothetical protein